MSRIRTNLITNRMANGAPTVSNGLVISGVTTSTTFHGNGSNLTGIDTDLVSDTSPQLGGNLDVNTKNIVFGDSGGATDDRLTFGAGTDLSIYHDGSHSKIVNSTGVLKVQGVAGQSITFRNGDDSANVAVFNIDGATHLYNDSAHKFSTSSYGIRIVGELQIDSGHLRGDSTNGLRMFSDSTATTGITLTTGDDLVPQTNNAQDLGSTSLRWRNIYTNDLNLSNEGSTNSVDNTWGNYTIQEGESDLFLINNRSGKKYKFNLTEVS